MRGVALLFSLFCYSILSSTAQHVQGHSRGNEMKNGGKRGAIGHRARHRGSQPEGGPQRRNGANAAVCAVARSGGAAGSTATSAGGHADRGRTGGDDDR